MNHPRTISISGWQLPGKDLNNPEHAYTAVTLDWPSTFSQDAKDVIEYFDGSMNLFLYDGHFVVTDEALYLTEAPNGGGPYMVTDDYDEIEEFLESIARDYDADPDFSSMQEWEQIRARHAGADTAATTSPTKQY